jgi:hypothetical protein
MMRCTPISRPGPTATRAVTATRCKSFPRGHAGHLHKARQSRVWPSTHHRVPWGFPTLVMSSWSVPVWSKNVPICR